MGNQSDFVKKEDLASSSYKGENPTAKYQFHHKLNVGFRVGM